MPENKLIESIAKPIIDGPVKKSLNSVFDSLNRGVESLDITGTFEASQKKLIKDNLQNIKLLGMESPVPLPDIYYPTHVSTSIGRRLYEQEWMSNKQPTELNEEGKKKPAPRANHKNVIRGDEFVEKTKKVVALGGPGAGKTTFLKFLALAHADSALFGKTGIKTRLLPFFIHLPKFAKFDGSLFDHLISPLREKTSEYAVDFTKRKLTNGSVIVLLDSLDEVPANLRSDVISKIKAFETQYSEASIIISCRTADYEEVLENFSEVELSRLSKDAISKIVSAWFNGDKEKANRLLLLINNDDGVASLTETPLLLSLLCIQFRHDLQLPKRKVELYRRCIDALLRDWDSSRGFRRESEYENLSDDRKERLFEHVAGKFFIEQEAYEFKKIETISTVSDFIKKLGIPPDRSQNLLDEIERHHGIIEQLSQDYYCFSHTSLQEYFVARHALSRRMELSLATKNIENENWLPIIEFIVALAEDPSDILQLLIRKSDMAGLSNFPPMGRRTKLLWLLYRCLLSSPFVDQSLIDTCHQHMVLAQIDMTKIYSAAGVFPLAVLDSVGVRHVMLYANRPRPTLATALQPYRKFANQILATPMDGYCKAVLLASERLLKKTEVINRFSEDVLLISLLVPISSVYPSETKAKLQEVAARHKGDFIKQIVQQSISYIDKNYHKNIDK